MDTEPTQLNSTILSFLRQFREPAIVLRLNDDGIYEVVFVTEAFATLMECSMDEALHMMENKGYISFTFPDDRIFVRRMLRRHVNEEGGSNLIVRKTTARGRTIWCDIRYSFFTDQNRQYAYCCYYDITDLKEYEQRLRSAYTNLGDNFSLSTDHSLCLFRVNLSEDHIEDMQGRELYATDSLVSPYSLVMKRRAEQIVLPAEQELYLELFDPDELIVSYLKGRVSTSRIFYSKRPDNSTRYIRLTAQTTRHPLNGDIIAFVTEENANESKVKDTLLDRILVRQFDMVAWLTEGRFGVVIGDATRIKQGNIFPKARQGDYQTYIHTQVEPVLSGTPEERAAMLHALLPETIQEQTIGENPYVVNIVINLDNEIYHKRFDFYSIDPTSQFYIVLKSDTTDLQREQIRINTQLKLALEEAQQASVAKTAFLSRMSHEIRTPMNAIIGLGTLAMREPDLTENLKTYLTKIGTSAKYLLSLINDILDMSRIESGRMNLKNEEFAFSTLLDLVNTLADGQCRDKGLHYNCVVEGHVNEFYIGDDIKLRQILINILGNAVKFTQPGGRVTLSVSQRSSYEGQATIRFIIQDTGIGMEASFISRIFEPFSQEDTSNTTRYGGSGLGLAITKNILTLMNGDIQVQSVKGQGSTFTVTVPLREAEHENTAHNFELNAKDLRILIIDDEELACQHARSVLEEVGIHSETCLSVEDALKLIEVHHARCEDFDLILVGLRMTNEDEIAEIRSIRSVTGETATIVLMTYNWKDVEKEAREAGVDSFMSKPIFVSSVLQEFRNILSTRQQKASEIQTTCDLNGRTILLAEDVDINAEIMTQLLEIMGITAEHAENGQLAIEMFSCAPDHHYDAILMDVRMPVTDGLSASRQIRMLDKPGAQDIPIIAMTANAFDEDVQLSLQAGMNAHLTKPVEADHLRATLESLISVYDRKRGQSGQES